MQAQVQIVISTPSVHAQPKAGHAGLEVQRFWQAGGGFELYRWPGEAGAALVIVTTPAESKTSQAFGSNLKMQIKCWFLCHQ